MPKIQLQQRLPHAIKQQQTSAMSTASQNHQVKNHVEGISPTRIQAFVASDFLLPLFYSHLIDTMPNSELFIQLLEKAAKVKTSVHEGKLWILFAFINPFEQHEELFHTNFVCDPTQENPWSFTYPAPDSTNHSYRQKMASADRISIIITDAKIRLSCEQAKNTLVRKVDYLNQTAKQNRAPIEALERLLPQMARMPESTTTMTASASDTKKAQSHPFRRIAAPAPVSASDIRTQDDASQQPNHQASDDTSDEGVVGKNAECCILL